MTLDSRSSQRRALLFLAAVLCWLTCTVAQLEKYLSMRSAAALSVLGGVAVLATLVLLQWFYRKKRDLGRWSVLLMFACLALTFAVLYPKSQHHAAGKGSDREDALRVELFAIGHRQYPYDARTFLNHPPTPLPGAMLLASPFYFAGKIALQNLFWLALFLLMLLRYFRWRVTVSAFAGLYLLTALENLNDFAVGGD